MDFKNHISFRQDDSRRLVKYLEENHIQYSQGEIISAFDILESDPHWQNIHLLIQKQDALCLTETVFSKEECHA